MNGERAAGVLGNGGISGAEHDRTSSVEVRDLVELKVLIRRVGAIEEGGEKDLGVCGRGEVRACEVY